MAALLLNNSADVEARDDEDNWTPLHFVAWKNSVKVAKLLLQYNASVEAKKKDGQTALHEAAYWDSEEG